MTGMFHHRLSVFSRWIDFWGEGVFRDPAKTGDIYSIRKKVADNSYCRKNRIELQGGAPRACFSFHHPQITDTLAGPPWRYTFPPKPCRAGNAGADDGWWCFDELAPTLKVCMIWRMLLTRFIGRNIFTVFR
jgi:hypothetical protein